jgi:hypothetical protein
MTTATITHVDSNTMALRMDNFDGKRKDEIKAMAGAAYDNGAWLLSPMHLPRLKPLFSRMTVAPEVIAAYHAALRRMMDDLSGSLIPRPSATIPSNRVSRFPARFSSRNMPSSSPSRS